jgi:membrane-bound metal-dependent hydrolase YbcI (DUF457 family)
MQTYSHILMTATLNQVLINKSVPVRSRAFLIGSFLPDEPLLLLTLGAGMYYRFVAPLPQGYRFFEWFDVLYFTNPFWKAGHNLFHAPLMLLLLGLVGYAAARRGHAWGWSVVWLALGCGLHSGVDIVTHYNDGPLVLFPLNWDWRVYSPISYWDRDHYANLFAPLEHGLDLFFIGYLTFQWWRKRAARRRLA